MNISQKFNIKITGHKDITFIDVDETHDTKLYLDPYVIQALQDDFCTEAQKCISSFFSEVFNACRHHNLLRLQNLLNYASEPNETNLGMKRISKYGKGSTSQSLIKRFTEFYQIISDNPNFLSDPLTACMYIKNFDKDHMSDLITNILRKMLYTFTIEQCMEWNIPLSNNEIFLGYYWDYDTQTWAKLYGPALFFNNEQHILLVPKHIVRSRYVFNVECYIKQYILKDLQKWHLDNNTDMCTKREYKNGTTKIFPPIIDELYRQKIDNIPLKDYARIHSTNNISDEQQYIQNIFRRIRKGYGALTDSQLDTIVYSKHIEKLSA